MAAMIKSGRPTLKLTVIGVPVKGKKREVPFAKLPVSEQRYFRDLHKIIDEVFEEAHETHGWSWSQLADEAGLAHQTVGNLGDRVTKYPRFMTIYRLAKAVGWELVTNQSPKKAAASVRKAG